MNLSNFISELKRRNVYRVATAYAIAGWLIIQIFDTIAPQLGFPEWLAPSITVLILIGFPIALILAWAFELTPEGFQKSEDVDITESVTRSTSKKLNRVIIGVLSIGLLFVLVERIFFAESTLLDNIGSEIENASIAVLPFVNMSDDKSNEFFSDGLSEELLNVLAKVDELNVAGRTSSFKFKGQNENLSLIGEELNVNHILEGSVRKAGDRIRITAQLIKVADGYHMWSETYDRELTTENIFDIQDEISNAVLAELKIQLLDGITINTKEYTQDIEAYNLYLAGTQLEKNRIKEELEAAAENYKTAIRLDQSFALAYARLAWVYYLLHEYGDITLDELKPLMKENIDIALSIEPDLGKAVLAQAVYYRYTGEPEKGMEASERAIELIPNDPETWIVHRNAVFFSTTGDRKPEEWMAMGEATKRAYELDKNNPAYANMYARNLPARGEYREAIEILDRINRLYPDFGPAYDTKANIYSSTPYGELDKAFILIYEQYNKNPNDLNLISSLLAAAMNIDLRGLEDELVQEIKTSFAGNPRIIQMEIGKLLKNYEMEDLTTMIENLISNGTPVPSNIVDLIYFTKSMHEKDYVTAREYFIRMAPEVSSGEFDPKEELLTNMLYYSFIEEQFGNSDLVIELAPIICEEVDRRKEETESESEQLEIEMFCLVANKQLSEAVENYEKIYFDLNSKSGSLFNLNTDPIAILLKDDQEFKLLVDRIKEDVWKMRENTIEYLKAEGEWREEWEVGNQ